MASGKVGEKGGCPICGKPADPKLKPFCSTRCRQVDLNRWLSESYRIPGAERPTDAGDNGKNQSESED